MNSKGLYTLLALLLTLPLGAQSPETGIGVQPSTEVRYPQASDIINPVNLEKTSSANINVVPTDLRLTQGWYLQIVLMGTEDEVVAQSVKISSFFREYKLFLRPRNGEWRMLIGPLNHTQLQPMLRTAETQGLKDFILRRE